MSAPTLGLSFADMYKRVGDYLGLPTDADALDDDVTLAKQLVNDGYRRFITARPDWRFLSPLNTITFVADTAAYDLPDGSYGDALEPWTFAASTGPRWSIQQVDEAMIRRLQSAGDVSGDPVYAAVRPKAVDATSTTARWEVVFWPTPSAVLTVSARMRLFPDALSADTDHSVAGFQHDQTILAAALAAAELARNDTIGIHEKTYQQRLMDSIRIDQAVAPRRMGGYGDGSDDRGGMGRRPSSYFQVDTYNGTTV
jgi:hypothetical protein